MKKGQAGLEYIAVVGVVLVLLFFSFYYVFYKSSENIKLVQAEDLVVSLAKNADEVYALSPGTKKFVWVSLPGGVQSANVYTNEISLTLSVSGGTTDYTAVTRAPLIGTLPTYKGTYRISLEHLSSGVILVGTGNDTTLPQVTWKDPNGLACNPITLRANTNEPTQCKFALSDVDYDSMTYQMSGNSLGHSYDLSVQTEGDYLYYVRCRDSFNNTMSSSELVNYTINFTYCGEGGEGGAGGINETIAPVVTLINPDLGFVSNTSRIEFFYSVTDASPIFVCRLITEGSILENVYEPEREITNNITGDLNLGTYNWSINCTDSFGNQGSSSTREIEVNATLDTDLPVINLEAPLSGSIRNFNLVKFFYNVTDLTSEIYSCTLNILGNLDAGGTTSQGVTDYSVEENEQEQLSLSLNKGNYTWNISCMDNSIYRNEGFSEVWWVRVNSTTEESFLNSCAGLCGYEGYGDGACENNPAKCGDYCPDCYLPSGDQYCIGGPQSDTCCCVP